MPGHVKLGKAGEPDPDPLPYLVVSMEMKRDDMLKPYDPKKSVWVPTDDHGFREGLLESDDGTKAVVMCGHEVNQNIYIAEVQPLHRLDSIIQIRSLLLYYILLGYSKLMKLLSTRVCCGLMVKACSQGNCNLQ